METMPVTKEELIKLESEQSEKFLEELRSALEQGGDIGVASDYDHTLSDPKQSDGRDVSVTAIHPKSKQAFLDIISSGRDVVIISARGAKDIARIVDIPGINVVGSMGFETLDKKGNSEINPVFDHYKEQISAVLSEVNKRFIGEVLGLSTPENLTPIVKFQTPQGPVIFQPKGYNEKFPYGINNAYSLHLVPVEDGKRYIKAIEDFYNQAIDEQVQDLSKGEQEELRKMCHFESYDQIIEEVRLLDTDIGPVWQGSKRLAMNQLMREPDDKKRQNHFKEMPFHKHWIYSGDQAAQDGAVMRFEHLTGVVTHHKRGGFGIWSKPKAEDYKRISGADVTVDSVEGVAKLYQSIAELMKQFPVKN